MTDTVRKKKFRANRNFKKLNEQLNKPNFQTIFASHFLGNRGCVGLCLYNKINGIKDSSSVSEPKKSEVKVILQQNSQIIIESLRYFRS